MKNKKYLVLAVLAVALFAWFHYDLGQYLELEVLKESVDKLRAWHAENLVLAAALYFIIYVTATALSVPGALIITLAGGAIFGFWQGLLLVSFASSIGATLAFLVSRVLLRDWVQEKFSRQLKSFNEGFAKDGALYLFSLRLVPLFPFFAVNLVMGLLPISAWRFYWVSQIGMLAGTAVFVNAGTQLAQLDSVKGILSPGLITSFVLLGVFPIIAKWFMAKLQARKALAGYTKPEKFDTNLIVIGAGSAGLVSSLIAATVKAKVTLIERHKMGGDCLNTGCVPSKALIRSAKIASYMQRAPEFGLGAVPVEVNFPQVMERVDSIIKAIEPHDSVERYTGLGVDCVQGQARIISPWEVEVNGDRLTAPNIIIASGASAFVPDIPGLEQLDYLSSDTLWDIREAPKHLMVLGAGPIGCELAQAFAKLGTEVTLVTRAPRLLPKEDQGVSDFMLEKFQRQGMKVYLNAEPASFAKSEAGQSCQLQIKGQDEIEELYFDRLLIAIGRKANIDNMGLEELGIELTGHGTIAVNEYLQTNIPTIYAAGDIIGPYQFTHMASHQAWCASVNTLFGRFKRFKVDYSVVPWATFTDPEVARVGLNEHDAKEQGIAYEVTQYGIDDLDRAIADSEDHGYIKVLTVPGKDTILGATIVGYHAAELITEYVLAMKHGLGLNKILSTIHIYPTLSESNKFLAGEWRKARKPEKLLNWVQRFLNWSRG